MNLEDIHMTSGPVCVEEDDKVVQPLEELVRISIPWPVIKTGNNNRLNKIGGSCWQWFSKGCKQRH